MRFRSRVDGQRRQNLAGGCRLAEHDAERQRTERVQDGDDRDRGEWRVEAVACRCLAVAAYPVPGKGQEQGGEPKGGEVRGVDQKPGAEAGGGSEEGSAQQREREQRHEHDVGVAAERRVGGEHRDLYEDGHEDEQRGLDRVEDHWSSSDGQ